MRATPAERSLCSSLGWEQAGMASWEVESRLPCSDRTPGTRCLEVACRYSSRWLCRILPDEWGRGAERPPGLAVVCLSLCVSLWCLLWSLSPSCVPCIPEGVTPVSASAVRCPVYLKGSSWQALSTWNPPYMPHTLECIPSHPHNLLTPSSP